MTRDEGLVCCSVGDKQYALRAADVRHIVRVEKMRAAAGSDGRVGTLELAGQPVPVFRLGSVFGRTGPSEARPATAGITSPSPAKAAISSAGSSIASSGRH